jgi:hypothetical protein
MGVHRQQRFVYGQVAWMVGSIFLLVALDALSSITFFFSSFIGFLILIEMTRIIHVTPQWRTRIRWITALGFIVVILITVYKIVSLLPSKVIP